MSTALWLATTYWMTSRVEKDDDADDVVAAYDEFAEGRDDLPGVPRLFDALILFARGVAGGG